LKTILECNNVDFLRKFKKDKKLFVADNLLLLKAAIDYKFWRIKMIQKQTLFSPLANGNLNTNIQSIFLSCLIYNKSKI